jgi:tetratricopeptide (TPR) repeat protein
MKRLLFFSLTLLLVLFAIATALRIREPEEEKTALSSKDAERVRRFWEAYHRGAEARSEDDFERAASFFREALAIDPRHEDSLFYLGIALEESGRYREAAEILRRLTAVNRESGRGWSELGSLLARRAPGNVFEPAAAAAAFERAFEINREHSGTFLSRGALALDLGDLPEAKRLFRIASDMSSPEGAFLAGLVSYLEGKDEEAIASFLRVLQSSEREKAITGRGVSSEGDVALVEKLTPLESAHLRALLFLRWSARRSAGYPEEVPSAFRIELPPKLAIGRVTSGEALPKEQPCADLRGWSFDGTIADTTCGDYDGNGEIDVFVLLWKKPARLLRSEAGTFTDVTEKVGLSGVGGEGLAALFFDFDRDSDPDLLVTAHAPHALSLRRLLSPEGRAKRLTPRLYENDRGERFLDVTARAGLDRQFGIVDAEGFDVDSDGWVDLLFALGGFEASHLEPSVVLRNRGGKDFVEWAHIPSTGEPRNAYGVEAVKRGGEVQIRLLVRGGT